MKNILKRKNNELGIVSSVFCIIHCLATPFLLAAVSGTAMISHGSQEWWSWLDILFLIISFIAVFISFQQSNLRWMKVSLMISWFTLSFFVLNERLEGVEFPIDMVYFPAVALIILHIMNIRQSRNETECCDNDQLATEMSAIEKN